ncbi:hypothetical protein HHK36_022631 [Tetracentron sinense]|uniref:Uncharacterized protein n=1 Tax=Tetracentron sinense TaxID=13715 RepID=A0A834YN79_TETSI|nr:hypothetical protein HHK36_022631 [Tetracentron sinense]
MALQQTLGIPGNLFRASQNPNIKPSHSSSLSFPNSLSSSTKTQNKQLGFHRSLRCSIDFNNNHERVAYPRPSEIPWKKELCNSVNLIGIVGTPVQIKHLSSGKVLAWTRLGVKKSATDTVWINLTLWDELACVAFQHVEKGHRIYVSGRLVSDTVEGDDEKRQTYYKVVVQQLNFIEKTFSPLSPNERDTNSMTAGGKLGNYANNNSGSTEELWQAFFANPVDWWDNRNNKIDDSRMLCNLQRNPKYPDFKHKDTGEALWVEGKYNPPWVKSQLTILDSRMESLHAHEGSMPFSLMAGDDFTPF